jgi:cobalt-zinc-cadmium efflux system outer membrane protein
MRISKAGAWLACLWCGVALAATPDDSALTLTQAIDNALTRNPELRGGALRQARAQAMLTQAQLRPATELALELENFSGSGDTRGADSLESTLSFTQILELGDKRATRIEMAELESGLASLDQRARELDVLADVTRRFLATASAAEQLKLAQETERLAIEAQSAISRRVAAARSPLADESRARIATTRANLDVQQAASTFRSRRYALAASWGDAEPQFASVRADLFEFEADPVFPALMAKLERNPAFERLASSIRLRDAEVRLAQAQSRPDLALTLGLRHLHETGDTALVAGVAMPLAGRKRSDAGVRAARAEFALAEVEQEVAQLQARQILLGLYEEMTSARRRVQGLLNDALPLARSALEQTQAGYDRGRFAFFELASARQELLALQSAAIESAATYHELRTEIQRLTGEPLHRTEGSTP